MNSNMKSTALGLAEGSGAKLSHVLMETSPRQESETTTSFLAWLGHCFKKGVLCTAKKAVHNTPFFKSLFQHVT